MAPQTRNHPHHPPATDSDVKLRRAHRKSRNGCNECKRRHVKCDETRPACVNCATAERRCSYLDSVGSNGSNGIPATAAAAAAETPSPSFTAVLNDFVTRTDVDRDDDMITVDAAPANGQVFTLEHMRLLHHVETNMSLFMCADELTRAVGSMHLENALAAPYLMDALLALAARHMAELYPSRAAFHARQAAQLQTRALTLFNAAREDLSDDTCIPMFLFTSILGAHLLCDTLRAHRRDFNAFLDQFAWYLNLQRGVSAVTGHSWHVIRRSGIKDLVDFLEVASQPSKQAPEVDILHRMLDRADLGPASLQACRDASDTLRHSYAIYRTIASRSAHQSASVMAFGVRVTPAFIDVLKQRRPEALVILAFYAVLLHWCRDFWVFADAGQFMIRSIAAHLGDYWSEWLAFPISVLEG
ncbi:Upc2 protein [Colletotrichum cereale]|nr:Upc2 protein [Colletotrichum cereale]